MRMRILNAQKLSLLETLIHLSRKESVSLPPAVSKVSSIAPSKSTIFTLVSGHRLAKTRLAHQGHSLANENPKRDFQRSPEKNRCR